MRGNKYRSLPKILTLTALIVTLICLEAVNPAAGQESQERVRRGMVPARRGGQKQVVPQYKQALPPAGPVRGQPQIQGGMQQPIRVDQFGRPMPPMGMEGGGGGGNQNAGQQGMMGGGNQNAGQQGMMGGGNQNTGHGQYQEGGGGGGGYGGGQQHQGNQPLNVQVQEVQAEMQYVEQEVRDLEQQVAGIPEEIANAVVDELEGNEDLEDDSGSGRLRPTLVVGGYVLLAALVGGVFVVGVGQ